VTDLSSKPPPHLDDQGELFLRMRPTLHELEIIVVDAAREISYLQTLAGVRATEREQLHRMYLEANTRAMSRDALKADLVELRERVLRFCPHGPRPTSERGDCEAYCPRCFAESLVIR
jgi:hypothetical protein